jgi:hypothetical protein
MAILKIINSFIQNLDMIGRKPNFRINDQRRFKTTIGGLFSFIIYILLILSILNFGQDLYYRTNPNIISSRRYVENGEPTDLSKVGLFFSFYDTKMNVLVNTTYYDLKAYIIEESLNMTTDKWTSKIIPEVNLVPCQTSLFPISVQSMSIFQLYNHSLGSLYCFPNNSNVFLNQYINEEFYYSRRLQIQVSNKVNATNENAVLDNVRATIIYSESVLDEKDYVNTVNVLLAQYKTMLSLNLLKTLYLNYQRAEVHSDAGIVLSDWEKSSFLQVQNIYENSDYSQYSPSLSKPIFSLEVGLTNLKVTYYRKYMKIQFVLAEVGGMMKCLIIIAGIINFMHNTARFYEKMIAAIFDIEDLNKYFGFYEEKNKHLYLRYRDSIALRRVKDFDFVKRDRSNISSNPLRQLNNYFTDLAANRQSTIRGAGLTGVLGKQNGNGLLKSDKGEHENTLANIAAQEEYENTVPNNNTLENEGNNPAGNVNQPYGNGINLTQQQSNLKRNKSFKSNFDKVKNDIFQLTNVESFKVICCCKSKLIKKKKNILDAGKFLINSRLDVTTVLKKILDFDRFKNLVLKDHQLILLNSLSRFLLDPETLNLVEFKNITFDKLIDSLIHAHGTNSVIDYNLKELVKNKYQLDNKASEI